MSKITRLKTGSPIEERHGYSRLVMVDDVIYMALCAGVNPETGEIPEDPVEQAKQAISNIQHSLEKVGSGLFDIVRFVSHIPKRENIYPIQDYVGKSLQGAEPVMSLYCGQLGADRFACEFEVTAHRGAGKREVERIDSGLMTKLKPVS